ncbi:hypothetical protein S40285_06856 [Stachybotrys chlorohalonatus IBT 40285]|uniref:Major facilitator superfamily (MFS) profile domain-containing protein n=1 Tax=Stachybotrys chlorohalonatus (strain IBT 40285) TaxID=1283841 RepID=A0A084QGB4_STAC4|nr:hypothetical protein S40285_06856 [Stachybotrys chlorohalonata IBT 40285]
MTENNGRPSSASNREVEQDKVYEPIAARQSTNNINGSNSVSLSKTQSRASRRSGALYRTRSQNGYGVADHEPDEDEEAQAGQLEKDPFEVGWDGADDPLCPRSFSKGRKWMITFIVSGCSFCVTCASSIYTSAYEQMEAEFHNSRIISVLGLSTFVLGISLGPMLFGPLSEFYGRRPIYLVAWALYVIWIVPQAVAQNMATIIVCRFFNAFAGSTFLAVSGGTVGDLFANKDLSGPMAVFTISPFIGPSIGPLLGGFINYNVDWRWTFYVLLIWAFVLMLAIVLLVPETYHSKLLKKKAAAKRKETGDDRWLAPGDKVEKSVVGAMGRSLLRPFQLLMFEFMCLSLCIYSAILLGILYLFFGVFPLVFRSNHNFNLWQVGLTFLGMGVGMVLGILTDPVWHRIRDRLIQRLERETGVEGKSEPEFRLPSVIFGCFLVPVGLFWFGWTTYSSVHWIDNPVLLGDIYLPAAFPLFGTQMFQTLGYPWATSLLGFLTLVMLPFPYVFFKFGKRLRAKSRYAKS